MKKFFARFKKRVTPRPYELHWMTSSGFGYRLATSPQMTTLLEYALVDTRNNIQAKRVTWFWRANRFIGIVDGTDSFYEIVRTPR